MVAQGVRSPGSIGPVVAIMQPYFFPYAGYYRLFAAADTFVILDCVQFARRGRVHRCEVDGPSGLKEWLTLPLARQPQDVLIRDLAFAPQAEAEFQRRVARHSWAAGSLPYGLNAIARPTGSVGEYLVESLRATAGVLGLNAGLKRSSEFGVSPHLKGEARIIAIAKAAGAAVYLNSPGGRALYHRERWEEAGMKLSFLQPWQGKQTSILPDLVMGTAEALRASILEQAVIDKTVP